MKIELQILESIHSAVYDTFYPRLSDEEWEKAEAEFQEALSKNLGKIEIRMK